MRRERALTVITAARAAGESPLLIDADLAGLDLAGLDLSEASLNGATLRGADLRRADLSGAFLSRADLRDADLRDADLAGAFLDGALLAGALLQGATLRGAYVAETDFTGVDLHGIDLTVADHEKLPPLTDEGDGGGSDDGEAAAEGGEYARIPAPPLTAAQRRLPGFGVPTAGTTLPVRLGEEFGARLASGPLAAFAVLVVAAAAAMIWAVVWRYLARPANFTVGGRFDPGNAFASFLEGPAGIVAIAICCAIGVSRWSLRQRRAVREELATIVEIERDTLAPGQRARLYVELRRAAPVAAIGVALVCWQVSRGRSGMRRQQVEFMPLVREGRLALSPGASWERDLTITIPRDARRHNFDPASSVWISWAIQLTVESPGLLSRVQTFPFRVE